MYIVRPSNICGHESAVVSGCIVGLSFLSTTVGVEKVELSASIGESRCDGEDSWDVHELSRILPSCFLNGTKGETTVFGGAPSSFNFFDGRSTSLSTFMLSHILFCPAVLSPLAPLSHAPFSSLPSLPKSRLPAPTVSDSLTPPPWPAVNCSRSFIDRESRHDVLPPSLFSARWWPVEEEFQASKMLRVGFAATGVGVGILGTCLGDGYRTVMIA